MFETIKNQTITISGQLQVAVPVSKISQRTPDVEKQSTNKINTVLIRTMDKEVIGENKQSPSGYLGKSAGIMVMIGW